MKKLSLQIDFWGLMIMSELLYRHSDSIYTASLSFLFTIMAGYVLYKAFKLPIED